MKIISKAVSAAAFAALVAGSITVFMGATSGSVSANAPLDSGKGDRLDIRADAPNCAAQSWPNYDAGCLKDRRQSMSTAKQVRIITGADNIKVDGAKAQLAKVEAAKAETAKVATAKAGSTDVSAARKIAKRIAQ